MSLEKSCLSKVKSNEAKLLEDAMQVKSNQVVNIIRRFHPEWGSNFLDVREKDVENTFFYECRTVLLYHTCK